MRPPLAVIAFTSLLIGCRQRSEFEFRRASEIKTSSADEIQQRQTVKEFRIGSQTELDDVIAPKVEQPSFAEEQATLPTTAEQDLPATVEVSGSLTIINGDIEIHEHRHEHMHLHVPSAPLEEHLKSHEISPEWRGRDVEEENRRRREELLRDLHTKPPVDPYCDQKLREHEARVRQLQEHMQALIERSWSR